jgi:hypothetical protein
MEIDILSSFSVMFSFTRVRVFRVPIDKGFPYVL